MFLPEMLLWLSKSGWLLLLHLSARTSFPKPLPPEEERALLARMQAGDGDAANALIEHNEGDTDAVYELIGYTEEMAQRNRLLDRAGEDGEGVADDRLSWARATTQEVEGDAIEIVM